LYVHVRPAALLPAGTGRSTQVESAWHPLFTPASMWTQVDTPSPKNPAVHAHVNEPTVLEHVVLAWQLWDGTVHSLASAHAVPLPVNPVLHAHVKEEAVSAHVAFL
jgi:hypothetical protein